jgi:cytochrome oxidase assembly protein ShyY1
VPGTTPPPRELLRTLRQPRYVSLGALMVLIATACSLAGTWQIYRLAGKVHANDELRHNAHLPAAAVADVLPLVGSPAAPPHSRAVQFRTITATGTFDGGHQSLLRQAQVNDDTGYLVVTPLVTPDGTLLIVRGFISGTTSDKTPVPPAPLSGQVTVRARVQPADKRSDQAAALTGGQVESINPVQQAARLGTPVFDGYAELLNGQAGVGTLVPIPDPDLSNPAGGAIEPQHLAYVIQWYLFAVLALAAPVVMARSETRRHDIDDTAEFDDPVRAPDDEQARAAKLADRYGRAR